MFSLFLLDLIAVPGKSRAALCGIFLLFHLSFLLLLAISSTFPERFYFLYSTIFSVLMLTSIQFLLSLKDDLNVEFQFLNIYMIFYQCFSIFLIITESKPLETLLANPLFTFFPVVFLLMLGYLLFFPRERIKLSLNYFFSFLIFIAIPFTGMGLFLINSFQGKTTIILSNTNLSLELKRFFSFFFVVLIGLLLSFIYLILNKFYSAHSQLLEYEKRNIARQRLESLGRLSASIAHELNNSLSSILGFTSLLLESEQKPENRKYLELIKNESEHLEGKLAEILNFSRSGHATSPVNLLGLLSETVEFVRQNRSLEKFSITLPQKLDAVILANPAEIKQVFLNLILNAAEATDHNGSLSIRSDEDGQSVRLYFQDNGPGVPEEMTAKLFEPFITSKREGNGLGLFISEQIMLKFEGEIALCKAEQGACFLLKFPKEVVKNG